ncbi:MAG TPA: transglycosylase SLT domain-containing protein [Polyangia bacterium]|nr:transglycosylase SLT domain-containing protein [Polyangia bacterium]
MIVALLLLVAPTLDPVAHLARGAKHYAEGDYEGAKSELLPVRDARDPAHDYVLYFLGQAAAYAGDRAVALDAFHRLAGWKDSRLAGVAAWREADMLYALARWSEAAKSYENLLKHGTAGGEPAVAKDHMAEAAAAAGRKDVALALFRRVYVEHPTHPLAEQALRRMTELSDKPPVITADERIRRAAALTAVREWDRSLEELARVPADAPQAQRDEADFAIGMTKYRTRHDYPGAAEALLRVFERLPADRAAMALFHGARALSRADQDDRAISYYKEVVRRFPRSRWATEAQFLIGWLEFNRGRYEAAPPGLTELIARYPKSEFVDDATWYLAFSCYLLGKLDDTLSHLERLARMPGEYTQAKARYWKARVLERRGVTQPALEQYRALVTDFPLSWYALLARARLREQGVELGPFGLAGRGDAPPLSPPEPKLAAEPALAKADELLAAGLPVEAGEELHRAEYALIHKLSPARALPVLFDRYQRAGNFNRIYLLGESYSGRALKMPPLGEARKWWEAAYPLAYRDLVEKWGPGGGNPDYYLFAIMRKESGFNPHDVSYADAIGLLQMIPPTSRRVAEQISHPYTEDVLYDPAGNVEFGSWYIGNLLRKFKLQIPIGAGSYNAGPKPMMKWLSQHGKRPLDEFVELVAYTQTREYMKLVTDNYAHYLYLYGNKVYEPPLTVDAKYVDNEINY